MDKEMLDKINENFAIFKLNFESNIKVFMQFSNELQAFNAECDEDFHNNKIDDFCEKLSPTNRKRALEVIKATKDSFKDIKDILERYLQDWVNIEEQHKKFTEIYTDLMKQKSSMQNIIINSKNVVTGTIKASGNVIVGDNNTNAPK